MFQSACLGIRFLSITVKSADAMISAGLPLSAIMRAIFVLPPASRWTSIFGCMASKSASILANGTLRLPAWKMITFSLARAVPAKAMVNTAINTIRLGRIDFIFVTFLVHESLN